MPSVPILCLICNQSFPENEYMIHMQQVHGTVHPDDAMKQQKMVQANIPSSLPQGLPPGIRPEDLPSPEFMAMAQQIDTAPPIAPLPKLDMSKSPAPPPSLKVVEDVKKPEPKPLQLKYVWDGVHTCGHAVKTIMITAGGELWANAYCESCNEVVMQTKVHPIINPIEELNIKDILSAQKKLGRPKKEVQSGQ